MGIEFNPATIPPFFAFSFKEHVSTLIFIKYCVLLYVRSVTMTRLEQRRFFSLKSGVLSIHVDVKSSVTFHKLNNLFISWIIVLRHFGSGMRRVRFWLDKFVIWFIEFTLNFELCENTILPLQSHVADFLAIGYDFAESIICFSLLRLMNKAKYACGDIGSANVLS